MCVKCEIFNGTLERGIISDTGAEVPLVYNLFQTN